MLEFIYKGDYMKKFITLLLAVFCLIPALAADGGKYNSPTLNMMLEYGQLDTDHQQQLIKAFSNLVTDAKKAKAKNKEDVFRLIITQVKEDKIKEDVDFGLLTYSVLEELGFANNLYMVDVLSGGDFFWGLYLASPRLQADKSSAGKMTYYSIEQEGNFIANPSNTDLDSSFPAMTKNDVKSLILARAARSKFFEGKVQYYPKKPADVNILTQAEELAKQALKLSPRNTVAIQIIGRLADGEMPYTFYNPNISEADNIKKRIIAQYDIQMLAIAVANRANNFAAKMPDPFICNASVYCKASLTAEAKKNMSSKTFINILQKYPEFRDMAGGTINRLYNNTILNEDLYKTVLYLGNAYAKFKDINEINDVHVFYFQMAISNAILKNYQDFYKYRELFYEHWTPTDAYDPWDYGIRMKNATTAVDIITGKKTIEDFMKEYKNGNKNDIHKMEIDDEFVEGFHEIQRILYAWEGHKNFSEQVKKLSK